MAWWSWAIGGAVLLATGGTAAVVRKRSVGGRGGHLLTSEEARMAQLLPQVRSALQALRARLDAEGIPTHVGSTRRDPDEQAAIVARGRSATKRSWHLLGRAVDLYPLDPATGQPDTAGRHFALFRRMHELADTVGPMTGRWGWRGLAFNADGSRRFITTNKGKVWDGGHLEFPEGMTYEVASRTPITKKGGKLA
jgi:hypothetical protein